LTVQDLGRTVEASSRTGGFDASCSARPVRWAHSTTIAYKYRDEFDLRCLFFDMGQLSAPRELRFAKRTSFRLALPFDVYNDHGGRDLLAHVVDQPHYLLTEGSRASVKPMSAAAVYAELVGIPNVFHAITRDDLRHYPKVPRALELLEEVFSLGNDWAFSFLTPFVERTNADVLEEALSLGVPLAETWSCRWGYHFHCGVCQACVDRRASFQVVGADDPTEYMDAQVAASVAAEPFEVLHPDAPYLVAPERRDKTSPPGQAPSDTATTGSVG
jgi:7-cyano-7-deazaguanine synthase in queuosine biosynthesis